MSNLKWQTIEELQESRTRCECYINDLKSKVSRQEERLKWINHYIHRKTREEEHNVPEDEPRTAFSVWLGGSMVKGEIPDKDLAPLLIGVIQEVGQIIGPIQAFRIRNKIRKLVRELGEKQ